MFLIKFLYLCPFVHTIDISGANVRIFKGKEKHTMFFCLGGPVSIKLLENGSPIKLLRDIPNSLLTQILKSIFCKYGFCSLYIVKSLAYFCCEAIFIIFPWTLIVTFLSSTPPHCNHLPQIGTDPVFISLIIAVLSWYQDGFQPKVEMRVIVPRSK